MKLSVVVPVYNTGQYIERCLRTLPITRDDCKVEVILVDDCSDDQSWEITEAALSRVSFSSLCVEVIRLRHKANLGLSAARNSGLELATGDYIIFVDSDDWLDSDFMDIFVREMSCGKTDVLVFGFTRVSADVVHHERHFYPRTNSKKPPFMRFASWEFGHLCTNKVYRRSLLENVRFLEGILHEDELFSVEIFLKATSVKRIDKSLYYYRERAESICSSGSFEARADSFLRSWKEVSRIEVGLDHYEAWMGPCFSAIRSYFLESAFKYYAQAGYHRDSVRADATEAALVDLMNRVHSLEKRVTGVDSGFYGMIRRSAVYASLKSYCSPQFRRKVRRKFLNRFGA